MESEEDVTETKLITEVQIIPVKPDNGLIAFASFIFKEGLFLGDIAIHTTPTGEYRLVYPAKKIGNRTLNVYHPINKELGTIIQEAIIERYREIILH